MDQLRAKIQSKEEAFQLLTSSEQTIRETLSQREMELINLNEAAEEREHFVKSQVEYRQNLEHQVGFLFKGILSSFYLS